MLRGRLRIGPTARGDVDAIASPVRRDQRRPVAVANPGFGRDEIAVPTVECDKPNCNAWIN